MTAAAVTLARPGCPSEYAWRCILRSPTGCGSTCLGRPGCSLGRYREAEELLAGLLDACPALDSP